MRKVFFFDFMHEAACYIGNFAGKDTLTWLIYAQHYGAPTRLLDWTSNPLVALYFACKDVSKDGYVAVLNINKFNRFKAEALKQQIDKENMGLTIKELIEKSLLDRDCYEYPIVHLPQYIDSRMSAQSSYFLAWGRDKRSLEDMLFQHKNKSKAFSGDNRYILFKIMIDKDLKLNLLRQLDTLGINEKSIFPGMDEVGKYIENKYNFNNYCDI